MRLVLVDVLQFFKSKLVCETSIQELVLSLAMNVSFCGASLVLPRLDFVICKERAKRNNAFGQCLGLDLESFCTSVLCFKFYERYLLSISSLRAR